MDPISMGILAGPQRFGKPRPKKHPEDHPIDSIEEGPLGDSTLMVRTPGVGTITFDTSMGSTDIRARDAKKDFNTLYSNEWLDLRETDGYVYSHESRCGGKIVCILVVDRNRDGMVLGRYEVVPCHFSPDDSEELVSITGGVENDDPVATAIMEVREEAGYTITKEDLNFLGEYHPSKSADTTAFLYWVDVAGKPQQKPEGDGSEGEKHCRVEWMEIGDAVQSCVDPLFFTCLLKYWWTTAG